MPRIDENQSLYQRVVGDGSFLLYVTGLALLFSGLFAQFLAFTRWFLPHDATYVGFAAYELEAVSPRLVDFMFHNRSAWGGSLIAIGLLWLWLIAYPFANRQSWSRRALLGLGIVGFSTFLSFIGYGYLDYWHAAATVALLPLFFLGIWRAYRIKTWDTDTAHETIRDRLKEQAPWALRLLTIYAGGLLFAGIAVMIIGCTVVFVPEDLAFIEMCAPDVAFASERLLPVIAHDRTAFGGGLLTTGLATLIILYRARPSKSSWQVILASGGVGFVSAIGIHLYIGYTSLTHLLPAYAGLMIFVLGMILSKSALHPSSATSSQS